MKREGTFTVTWKVEGDSSAETHYDGHEDLPDRIKAMIADSMVRQGEAMSDPDILDRIDDTLDDWDQWDGHSPDAARWRGGPTEPTPTMQAMAQIAVVLQASFESFTAAMKKVAESSADSVLMSRHRSPNGSSHRPLSAPAAHGGGLGAGGPSGTRGGGMGDRTCELLIINLTGLVLWLVGDDPVLVGLGVVVMLVAVVLMVKDRITDELARRRP